MLNNLGYGGHDSGQDGYEPDLKRGRMDAPKRVPLEKLAEMEQRGQQQHQQWSRHQYY